MTPSDSMVHRYLSSLPEPELPDTLWPRIRRACRSSKRGQGSFWLTLAASAGGFGLFLALQGSPASISEPAVPIAEATHPDVHSQVAALDQAILAGYARGAGSIELAPLWRARQSLASDGQLMPTAQPVRL